MIMPIDIDKKEFSRDKRGYNSREVDEFLDLIVVDYEKVLNDNRSMAHKIKSLEKQLEEAQKSDNAMVETLQTAKKLMADISASAERRAEVMMRDAEIEADNILMDAKAGLRKLNDEHEFLAAKVVRFRNNFRNMLEKELAELENDGYNLLSDVEKPKVEVGSVGKESVPAKTIVVSEGSKAESEIETGSAPKKERGSGAAMSVKGKKGSDTSSVTDLEHATISDLSDSLRKMAEQPASLSDTIILK